MSEISDDDKEILVVLGCRECSQTCFEDVYVQLFDVDEKKWYIPFLISANNRYLVRSDCLSGIVGSELYFYADLTRREPANDDEPVEEEETDEPEETENVEVTSGEGDETDTTDEPKEYLNACHSLDFVTKQITHVGDFPYLDFPTIVIGDLIYSCTYNMVCLNTKDKSITKNPDELKVYYSSEATVFYNGFIYGIQESLEDFCDFALISHNMNTKENKILTAPPLENDKLTMVLFNGKLYAVENSNLKNMAVYTIETDEWEIFQTWGPPIIIYGVLIVCNGRLFCVEQHCRIYEFNFDKKEWNFQCHDYKGPIAIQLKLLTIKKSLVANWE